LLDQTLVHAARLTVSEARISRLLVGQLGPVIVELVQVDCLFPGAIISCKALTIRFRFEPKQMADIFAAAFGRLQQGF